jgi:hypothetical protein
VRSDFAVLTSDQRIRPSGAVDHCSVSSPDSPMNYSGVARRKTRERPDREVPRPGHRTVSGAPLAAPILVFAPNFVEFSNSFSLLVYIEFYAPEINDN